jgi:anaerobic magnesium-protoporphyrin IX monomethyl ester cyclase
MTKPIKVIVGTTPNRDDPTDFPPVGALSVLNHVRENNDNIEVAFYNIDALRPTRQEIMEYVRNFNPDVFGISAVVSTAYAFCKQLAHDVKSVNPDIVVVIGGNGAAAANVILEKTEIDICVMGEGEVIFNNIIKRAAITRHIPDYADIPGLVILDESGVVQNTGYETQIPAEKVWNINWQDLEDSGTLDRYIYPMFQGDLPRNSGYRKDTRYYEPHRREKYLAGLDCVKGCVARCTFCHRWDKGIRHIPVDILEERLQFLIQKYNVGEVNIHAETFGADKRWLDEFLEMITKYDLLWHAGGVRANTMDIEWLKKLKAAGCVSVSYGNETGSVKMLQIMEKKVSLEENYQAMKDAVAVGFTMGMQFVLGMPGECEETVRETIEYIKYGTSISPKSLPDRFAVGYAQALPGTPLYEYARHKGFIGQTSEEEEAYLISMSNKDASDEKVAINYTDTPRLRWLAWRPLMSIEVNYHYVQKYGLKHYFSTILDYADLLGGESGDGAQLASNILLEHLDKLKAGKSLPFSVLFSLIKSERPGLTYVFFPVLFFRLRRFITLIQFVKILKIDGWNEAGKLGIEYATHHIKNIFSRSFTYEYKSLRKIVDNDLEVISSDTGDMAPLRKGR